MERTGPALDVPPTDPDLAPVLARRLEAVERDNRRLRRLSTMTLLGLAILLGLTTAVMVVAARHGMPGMVPQVAEAKKFLLRDGDGRVRGAWGTNEDGSVQMLLQDAAGRSRLRFSVLRDGSSGLAFVDSANHSRIVVGVLPDESANIVVADQGGKTRAVFGIAPNGATTLVFADRGGTTKAGIGVDNRGLGTLNLVDRPGGQIDEPPEDDGSDSTTAAAPAESTKGPRKR